MSSRPFLETCGAAGRDTAALSLARTGRSETTSVLRPREGPRGCAEEPGGFVGPTPTCPPQHLRSTLALTSGGSCRPRPALAHRAGCCPPSAVCVDPPGPGARGWESFWEVAICPGSTTFGLRLTPAALNAGMFHGSHIRPPLLCCLRQPFRRQPGARGCCPVAVRGDMHQNHFRRVLVASRSTEVGSGPRCWMGPVSGKEAWFRR